MIELGQFDFGSGKVEIGVEEGETWDAGSDYRLLPLCVADEHFVERRLFGVDTEGSSAGSLRIGIDQKYTHSQIGKRTSQIYCDCCLARFTLVSCDDEFFHDMIEYEEIGNGSSTTKNVDRLRSTVKG